jgi:hypothetical protein
MEEVHWSNNPNLFGHGCVLSAYGIGFEPTSFLSETSFDPELILYKGKMGFRTFEWVGDVRPRTKEIFEYTHLILNVSKSGVNPTQHTEAMLFLKQYEIEILRLSKFPNVEHLALHCGLTKGESFEDYPDKLIDLADDCGITHLM